MALIEEHENQLVLRACARDHAAFSELYTLYFERIYRYARLKLGAASEAEDVTSIVFFNAWRTIDRFSPQRDASFAAWLFRIARHAVIDRYRRTRDTLSLDTSAEQSALTLSAILPGPEAQVERQIDIDELYAALRRLNPEQREVVLLRFVEGMSAREVGDIMGKHEGAVRGMQFRAIESLRRILASQSEAGQ